MKSLNKVLNKAITLFLIIAMTVLPVCAGGDGASSTAVQPRYNNIGSVVLSLEFDMNNVAYCGISVTPFQHGSGISGLMKIFDSDGVCLKIWSVSDYVDPIMQEFTYQCEYGETYTVTFAGYAYSNNGTAADRLELSVSNTCIDRN
ncbi:MAG: hypothetical protein IIV45_15420 [Lachnospiraceae bacterium]|nr:hypothetical protein [Lachnospiraceae bacterium]